MEDLSEKDLSLWMEQCPLQDPLRFRGRRLALKVASHLLDPQGRLRPERLKERISPPASEDDFFLYDHLQKGLEKLAQEEGLQRAIERFSLPLWHKKGEELIRRTLWPERVARVETPHVRRAALVAWLTFLRQATGSCFATAPAILIQSHNPLQFFRDLYDLLTTGRLKRVVEGVEYGVPITPFAGEGDLHKSLLPFPHFYLSPGIWEGCKAAEVLPPSFSPEQAAQFLQNIDPPPETVKALFERLCLEKENLTEEEIEQEAHLSKLRMTPLLGYVKPSERGERVQRWRERVKKGSEAFLDFVECPLLRAWEYTLASFCDVKVDFARWNLSIGLGLQLTDSGGIAPFVRHFFEERWEREQREAAHYEREAQEALSRDDEWSQQQGAIASQKREEAMQRGEEIAQFYPRWNELFAEKLKESFQELFDPSLRGEREFEDDGPAGFRLVYKHGRRDPNLWSPIFTGEEYVQALVDLLSALEREIALPPSFLQELTTALIQFVQTPPFLEGALQRSKEAGRESPWHYVSGGTLETLLETYWMRNRPLTREEVIPHSPQELLAFLLEKKNSPSPLLFHSPTHAFLFYPNWLSSPPTPRPPPVWGEEARESLTHRFSDRLPPLQSPLFLHLSRQYHGGSDASQFRLYLLDCLREMGMRQGEELLDSFLYEELQKENPPLLFADTNWSGWLFGFVSHPITGHLELWRLNRTGRRGVPMCDWKRWLSPDNNTPWVLFPRLEEYIGSK